MDNNCGQHIYRPGQTVLTQKQPRLDASSWNQIGEHATLTTETDGITSTNPLDMIQTTMV